jgi:hypothetical protein
MDTGKFKQHLTIDKNNLDLEIMRQSTRVASSGARVELLEYDVREAQEVLDIIYSDLFIKYTKQLESDDRKVTKDYTVGLIKKNKTYKIQREKVSKLKRDLGISKARLKGMVTKTEMINQYCYNYRKELEQGTNRIKSKASQRARKEQ